MQIRTLPVYSRLADEAEVRALGLWDKLPLKADGSRWQLSQHQVETYKALTGNEYDVIFNTAMTGDGKSLAAYLRALQSDDHVISMYPTNELIRDQATRVSEYKTAWRSSARSAEMYSAKITELMGVSETHSRVEQIRRLLEQYAMLLTNPDLFHLMLNFKLGHQAWERKELPFEVPANFDYFIFDEFHVFGVPQIINVVNAINYLLVQYHYKPSDHKRFIFLSATPHHLMIHLLAQSGLHVMEINGHYQSVAAEGYRPILQPCALCLEHIDQERNAEAWIKEHVGEIVRFYHDHPDSKGAIIVNSVAAARRLKIWLSQNLPTSISVGENTGLTGWDERRASFDKHLLIGTSTVDIGVDFHINLLIFEATDAGTFIQRFGRLGRQAGFGTYQAYALLPKFIVERFGQKWAEASEVERPAFHNTIREEIYPTEQQFDQYKSRWGVWQTAHLVAQSERAFPKGTPLIADLIAQFDRAFDRPPGRGFEELIKQYWAKTHNEEDQEILEELTSFRGQSPLSCGLWDMTDDELKTYDLFFLLANTEFEVIDGVVFMAEVRRRGLSEHGFRRQLLYTRVRRYTDEREDYVLGLKRDLLNREEWLHHAQAFKGFYIKESRQPWIDAVNRALKAVRLVCVLSDKKAHDLKRQLWLPLLFPIYRLYDLYDSEFSVAFGQSALLLESLLFYRKTNQDTAILI
jgi:CRISPR-associated endonuclease/helicase Cas3